MSKKRENSPARIRSANQQPPKRNKDTTLAQQVSSMLPRKDRRQVGRVIDGIRAKQRGKDTQG